MQERTTMKGLHVRTLRTAATSETATVERQCRQAQAQYAADYGHPGRVRAHNTIFRLKGCLQGRKERKQCCDTCSMHVATLEAAGWKAWMDLDAYASSQ